MATHCWDNNTARQPSGWIKPIYARSAGPPYRSIRRAHMPSAHGFSQKHRMLIQQWDEICWTNPPYGRDVVKWVKKAHQESLRGTTVVTAYAVDFSRQVRRVHPVVVVQDPALGIGFANREIQKVCAAEIKAKAVDQDLIKPLTLLTIEDLEYLVRGGEISGDSG